MIDKFDLIKSKILLQEDIAEKLAFLNFKKKKIVFTNGCFDIIHRGHVEYLAKAANHGDVLIVGLNSDKSIKKIKGENRPIQDEYSRALILASMSFVKFVIIFDEETPYHLIQLIQPHILVKGSDYKPENIVGSEIVLGKGGKVATIDFIEGFSTSSIINKLQNK